MSTGGNQGVWFYTSYILDVGYNSRKDFDALKKYENHWIKSIIWTYKPFLIARWTASVVALPFPFRFSLDTADGPVRNCLHSQVLNHHLETMAQQEHDKPKLEILYDCSPWHLLNFICVLFFKDTITLWIWEECSIRAKAAQYKVKTADRQ